MDSSSGVVALFKELTQLLPTKLIAGNRKMRRELVNVVSDLAHELGRGLEIAIIRLEGAQQIDSDQELSKYLAASRQSLFDLHSEFKICKGLRNLRTRQKDIFDRPTYSAEIFNRDRIKRLMDRMEQDERLIYDELGGLLREAENLARKLKRRSIGVPAVQEWLLAQTTAVRARQSALKALAREFIDKV